MKDNNVKDIIENLVERVHKLKQLARFYHKRFVSFNVKRRLDNDEYEKILEKKRQSLKKKRKIIVSALL